MLAQVYFKMFKARDGCAANSLDEFTQSLSAARMSLTKDRDYCSKLQTDIHDMDAALSRLETSKSDLAEGIEGIDAECCRLSHVIERRRAAVTAQKKELDELRKPRIEEEVAAAKANAEAACERSTFSAHTCALSTQLLNDFLFAEPILMEKRITEKKIAVEAARNRIRLLQDDLKLHLSFISAEEGSIHRALEQCAVGEKRPREVTSPHEEDPQSSAPGAQGHRSDIISLALEVQTLESDLLNNRSSLERDTSSLTVARDTLRVKLRAVDKSVHSADEAHECAQQRLIAAVDNTCGLTCTSCAGRVAPDDIQSA